MGKKSKLKREKRQSGTHDINPISRLFASSLKQKDAEFSRSIDLIEKHLERYNATDVCIAINASWLWLPNISSQVKHMLALHVFSTMHIQKFENTKRIDTYEEFKLFTEGLYKILPQFPMLEDYVPEADWGDVKVEFSSKTTKILYGCEIERISDFLECFKIIFSNNDAAKSDMRIVLDVQEYVIKKIDKGIIGNADNIKRGNIETPSKQFWSICTEVLNTIIDAVAECKTISKNLIKQLGTEKRTQSLQNYCNMVHSGEALPMVFIETDNGLLPVGIRSMLGAVLTFWEKTQSSAIKSNIHVITKNISEYMAGRVNHHSIIRGPLVLKSQSDQVSIKLSAVLLSKNILTIVVAIPHDVAKQIGKVEQDILRVVSSGEEWSLISESEGIAVKLRHPGDRPPHPEEISILFVVANYSTSFMQFELPKDSKANVMFLTEMVSIFDSLNSVDELHRFWKYCDELRGSLSVFSMGLVDLFASFQDSDGVLIEGAIEPTMITIDPHWNASWRFRNLTEYWKSAPAIFPDTLHTKWRFSTNEDGVVEIRSMDLSQFGYLVLINNCHVYFMFSFDDTDTDMKKNKLLDLFVQCLSDSVNQSKEAIQDSKFFDNTRISTFIKPSTSNLVDEESADILFASSDIFQDFRLVETNVDKHVSANATVNLNKVLTHLSNNKDSRFENECVISWLHCLSSAVGFVDNKNIIERVQNLPIKKPRFLLTSQKRDFDTPDYVHYFEPKPEQYKLARRELATIFKSQSVNPGRYELQDAKVLIDSARDRLRQAIHECIEKFDKQSLLVFCIDQIDAIITMTHRKKIQIEQSFNHVVSYDRQKVFADHTAETTRISRNYRYLLECCQMTQPRGDTIADSDLVMEILARIDWLMVLYGASDVLHNGIDVGGVSINSDFIPEVFYSEITMLTESKFEHENAGFKLGIGLNAKDSIDIDVDIDSLMKLADGAFLKDCNFKLTHLLQLFVLLSNWQSIRGSSDLTTHYTANVADIVNQLQKAYDDISFGEAQRVVSFCLLTATEIPRLIGKTVDEIDVPIWEHTKRSARYTIKPLVPLQNDIVTWGAGASYKSHAIWFGSISNGYLPADFPWPNIIEFVRKIKSNLENKLEDMSANICARYTKFAVKGINFKSRFPKEKFDDVGDFDVLCYWPQLNHWLTIECKYNQPPFCLKDARRLRERIFGRHPDRGHFTKIERRRTFLLSQPDRLRTLLGWPAPPEVSPIFSECYVSLSIYWWMRVPPYSVPTHFVRVDALDNWIKSNILGLNC